MASQIDDALTDAGPAEADPSDTGSADPEAADADPSDSEPSEADGRKAELIAAAQARWVDALTDLGGRNTLLYYKDRRAGTLDLAPADPEALDRFLRTGSARLTRLFRDVDIRADAIRRVQVIYRKARELLEERGIRAGYLATGLACWDELFLEPAAPVLLRGLTITPTRARHDDFELTLDDARGQPGAAAQAGQRVRRGHRGTGRRAAGSGRRAADRGRGGRRGAGVPRSTTARSSARSPTPSCRWCATCRRRASCSATATSSPPSPATRGAGADQRRRHRRAW